MPAGDADICPDVSPMDASIGECRMLRWIAVNAISELTKVVQACTVDRGHALFFPLSFFGRATIPTSNTSPAQFPNLSCSFSNVMIRSSAAQTSRKVLPATISCSQVELAHFSRSCRIFRLLPHRDPKDTRARLWGGR